MLFPAGKALIIVRQPVDRLILPQLYLTYEEWLSLIQRISLYQELSHLSNNLILFLDDLKDGLVSGQQPQKELDNHHFFRNEDSLFLWPLSIGM